MGKPEDAPEGPYEISQHVDGRQWIVRPKQLVDKTYVKWRFEGTESECIAVRAALNRDARDKREGRVANRTFPIQGFAPGVPWAAAEQAYETYAKHFGNGQSLKRLAERGGFGLHEFACFYLGTVTIRNDLMEDRIGEALGKALAAPTTGGTDG